MNSLKCFISLFLCLIVFELQGNETPMYINYADVVIKTFINEMEEEYDLICVGEGGAMSKDIERVSVMFHALRKTTLEEARELEVRGVQKLLKLLNNNEKIKPYLREYPFNTNRVGVTIGFRNPQNYEKFSDGSVTLVYLAKNKIYYDGLRISMEKLPPVGGIEGLGIKLNDAEVPIERLYDIHIETFEEAVKTLGDNTYYKKKDGKPI